jgi:hypothetical protein
MPPVNPFVHCLNHFSYPISKFEIIQRNYVPKERKGSYSIWKDGPMRRKHFDGNVHMGNISIYDMEFSYVVLISQD